MYKADKASYKSYVFNLVVYVCVCVCVCVCPLVPPLRVS